MHSVLLSRIDRQYQVLKLGNFEVSIYTRRNPQKTTVNEDSVGLISMNDQTMILLVADGVGGSPKGDEASSLTISAIAAKLEAVHDIDDEQLIRNAILNGIETANQALIKNGNGAKTTVTVCEILNYTARSYQVGDSELLICGQKGKIKYRTTSHSPVGYGIEAGLIDQKSSLKHPDRHYISNVVGECEMKIEMGPKIKLAAKDTILVGSDGLYDNFPHEKLSDWIRVGKLPDVLENLTAKLDSKLKADKENETAKYDDVSFLILRLNGDTHLTAE